MSKLREECGVFGIFSCEKTDVAGPVYYGLYALQHRGQESCGIVVNDDGLFTSHKDVGLVNDVFTQRVLDRLGQGQHGDWPRALCNVRRFRPRQRAADRCEPHQGAVWRWRTTATW